MLRRGCKQYPIVIQLTNNMNYSSADCPTELLGNTLGKDMTLKGNQVKVLNDPVTVNGERDAKCHCNLVVRRCIKR